MFFTRSLCYLLQTHFGTSPIQGIVAGYLLTSTLRNFLLGTQKQTGSLRFSQILQQSLHLVHDAVPRSPNHPQRSTIQTECPCTCQASLVSLRVIIFEPARGRWGLSAPSQLAQTNPNPNLCFASLHPTFVAVSAGSWCSSSSRSFLP